MDPKATLRAAIEAARKAERLAGSLRVQDMAAASDEAAERLKELRDWIGRGGFAPTYAGTAIVDVYPASEIVELAGGEDVRLEDMFPELVS